MNKFIEGHAVEPFRLHLFVCTQQKPEGVPSCPTSGAFDVLSTLEREVIAQGLDDEVQLTTGGCMGLCDEGPVMVVYPEGVWYRKVQAADVAEIVSTHLKGGKPVERLVWRDAAAMKAMSTEHRDKFRAVMAIQDKAGALPERIDAMIRGYWPSRIVLTALELDLFTVIEDGGDATAVAKRANLSVRGAEPLLNALVSLGLLTKSGETFHNTAESTRYFTQGSPNNHRNGLLHTANIWHRWSSLTDVVRRGAPVAVESRRDWTKNFIAGMDRNAKLRAPLLVKTVGTSGVRKILDLGGGSGAYSIAFAKAIPDTQVEILDIAAVAPLAEEYIRAAGVGSQVTVRPGDMLNDEYGSGYDLVLLNAICHMFSPEQNEQVFRKAFAALAPGGRLVVQDFILNQDKTSPQFAALFSINMLVATEFGASYSEAEYAKWLKAAGFPTVERVNLPGPSDLIIGTKK